MRNTLDPDRLKLSKNMKNIEVYFAAFEKFIKIITVLTNRYTADNDIAFLEEDFLAEFLGDRGSHPLANRFLRFRRRT